MAALSVVAELRNKYFPTILPGMLTESITQSIIGRNASATATSFILYCLAALRNLSIKISTTVASSDAKIRLVMFDEIGVVLHPVAQRVKKRGLKSAKTIIQPWNMRFAEREGFLGLPCRASFVNNRTTWISQSHYLRAFVNGFTGGIINGLPQNFHIVIGFHQDNL